MRSGLSGAVAQLAVLIVASAADTDRRGTGARDFLPRPAADTLDSVALTVGEDAGAHGYSGKRTRRVPGLGSSVLTTVKHSVG